MKRSSTALPLALFCCLLAWVTPALARTLIVAQSHPAAADTNPATEAAPLKSIQAAADLAQPGDTILVHAGTYRERITPPRGGDAEERRITYRAAPGESVALKGSDRITTWTRERDTGLWRAELPNAHFADYNPYLLTIRGEWLDYGEGLHRGDVYLDGAALSERRALYDCQRTPNTWYSTVDHAKTTIWANFGPTADPNNALAEINVRQTVFFPEIRGLKFITVDGFTLAHSAENWGPPGTKNGEGQYGAIGPRFGYAWIIQNCTVINAKCIGICLGVNPFTRPAAATLPATTTSQPATASAPASRPARAGGYDLNTFGHHIIRNNHLLRCGQAGIGGDSGSAASLIEHNLVEFTNDRGLFGGDETAGIKFHFAIDTILSHNTIRHVGSGEGYGGFGIWLDFGNQNTRVSGNVISDTQAPCLFIEASHGPILVDNNIFLNQDINALSESQIFVHNLFYRSTVRWTTDTRRPPIWIPHTARRASSQTITPRDDKWLNNIFIGGGLQNAPDSPTFNIDYNLFLDGAKKSRFDAHSLTLAEPSEFNFYNDPNLIAVDFRLPPAALALQCPRITSAFLGNFPIPNMLVENPDASPIEINRDFFNQPRTSPDVPGPFQNITLHGGMNSFTLYSTVPGPARPYRITLTPATAVLKPGQKLQLAALAQDQFGNRDLASSFTWSATSGTIDHGLFTAGPDDSGPCRITVTNPAVPHPISATADLYISTQTPGLAYACYEGTWSALPDFPSLTPYKTGTTPNLDLAISDRAESYALRFDGRIYIPAAGAYTFFLNSDDGAKLFLDGTPVVDNDGGHANRESRGTIELTPGLHTLALTYFQGKGQQILTLEWQSPSLPRQFVPPSALFRPSPKP